MNTKKIDIESSLVSLLCNNEYSKEKIEEQLSSLLKNTDVNSEINKRLLENVVIFNDTKIKERANINNKRYDFFDSINHLINKLEVLLDKSPLDTKPTMEYMNKRIEERIVEINNDIKEIDKKIANINANIAILRGDKVNDLENNKVDEIRLKDEKLQEIEHLSAIKNNEMTPQKIIKEMKNMIAKAKGIDIELKKLIEVKKTSEKDKESYEQLYKEMSELYKQISAYEFDLLKYCLIPSKRSILEEMIKKLEEQEQQYSKKLQELQQNQYEVSIKDSKAYDYINGYNELQSLFRSKLNRLHNLKKLRMYVEGVLRFGKDMWKFKEGSEEYRKYEGCKSITYLMNQLLLFDNEKKIEQIKQVKRSKKKNFC